MGANTINYSFLYLQICFIILAVLAPTSFRAENYHLLIWPVPHYEVTPKQIQTTLSNGRKLIY